MAKKLTETSKQGNAYLESLLGNRDIQPLNTPAESSLPQPMTIPAVKPVAESKPADVPETKIVYKEKVPKTRASFTIMPDDLVKLKRIAYIKCETVSSIINQYLVHYIGSHGNELEEFEKLPESVKRRVDSSKY